MSLLRIGLLRLGIPEDRIDQEKELFLYRRVQALDLLQPLDGFFIKRGVDPFTRQIVQDYYWQMTLDEMYDVQQEPKELMIGQISDDWLELERLLINSEDAISYDLVRLAELLKILKYSSSGVW